MTSPALRRVLPAAVAAALLGGLSGCAAGSAGDGPPAASSARPAQDDSPSATTPPPPSPPEDFEESVNAETRRIEASASAALRDAPGRGNAIDDVGQRGVPTSRTDGKRVALVTVTNDTDEPAFFSVRVDFVDADGKRLDSLVLGLDDVAPGEVAQRYAISGKAAGEKAFPRIVEAQRTPVEQ